MRAAAMRPGRTRCSCIGQETTGPGGFAKALRTVPVVLRVAEAVREHAKPDAWIVDFTNPVGIVTRALLEAGHRAVGLCNVAIGFQRRFAGLLRRRPRAVRARPRRPQPPDLGAQHPGRRSRRAARPVRTTASASSPRRSSSRRHLLELLGVVPSYYLRYYYAHDEVLREQLHAPSRADAVQAVERELLAIYADETQ